MTVLILLTTAGAGTGPFNLYSNVDGYVTPFETGVAKASLTTPPGYTSALVPNGTTTVRVQSTGACTNYIDLVIGATAPTTTTSTTASGTPTTTTTSTTQPLGQCGEFSLEGGISGRTFNFTNCLGNPQTVVVNANDVTSECIQLPYNAAGATYITGCGTSYLSYTYGGGDGSNPGTFRFSLSSPLPSTITVTGGNIVAWDSGMTGTCDTYAFGALQNSSAVFTAGDTLEIVNSNSVDCADKYVRSGSIVVNGNTLNDGDTIYIGGVGLIIDIPNTCQNMLCVAPPQ